MFDLPANHDTILGTDLGKRLNGYGGDDMLSGAADDNALFGGTGDDRMQGGTGNDVYSVDAAGDQIVEQRNAGIDRVEATLTIYTLGAHVKRLSYLGTGTFTGTGNALDSVIIGGVGDDQRSGLDGDDTLTDGNDNDWQVGDAGASYVTTTASHTSGSQPITLSMTLPETATFSTTTVTGDITNATLKEAAFNLAFVLDVSGSKACNFSGSHIGEVNGGGSNTTTRDVAIAGFKALIASLRGAGLGSTGRMTLIPLSDRGVVLAQGDAMTDNDGIGLADEIDADPATLRNPSGIKASIRSLGSEAASCYDVLNKLDDDLLNHSAIDVLAPADLTAGLLNSQFHVAGVTRLEILLNGILTASPSPDQFIETPFGLKYSDTIPGLTPGGADEIATRIVPPDPTAG